MFVLVDCLVYSWLRFLNFDSRTSFMLSVVLDSKRETICLATNRVILNGDWKKVWRWNSMCFIEIGNTISYPNDWTISENDFDLQIGFEPSQRWKIGQKKNLTFDAYQLNFHINVNKRRCTHRMTGFKFIESKRKLST